MKFYKNLLSIIITLNLFVIPIAYSDTGILTPCSKSPGFTKRLNGSVKKLEARLKKYEPGTPPAKALESQINQTKERFKKYSNSSLMCGTDGLPHLITSGDWNHAGEFMLPGIGFLYIAGWIGWAGRTYLLTFKDIANPSEKEIIIDVPSALSIMTSSFIWPITAWSEFKNQKLIANKKEITVSPR